MGSQCDKLSRSSVVRPRARGLLLGIRGPGPRTQDPGPGCHFRSLGTTCIATRLLGWLPGDWLGPNVTRYADHPPPTVQHGLAWPGLAG